MGLIRRHLDVAVWIAIAIVALVWLEAQHVPRTFFFDEWSFVFHRRQNTLDSWLAPHNGHLSVIPALIYKVGFALFGLDHYRPYRIIGLLFHVAVATLLAIFVRRRQGPVAAIAVGALFLVLGAGWEVIYQPFTINLMGGAAFGMIAWLALDHDTRRRDVVAAVASVAALCCSGIGVAMVAGSAARLGAQRQWMRAAHVLGPAVGLYALWQLFEGEPQGSSSNIPKMPGYVLDEAASSVAGLAGRGLTLGRVGLVAVIVLVAAAIARRRAATLPALAPAVALVVNWVLVAYSRADLGMPTSSRYVYIGALGVLLVLSGLFGRIHSRRVAGGVVALCALGVVGNWGALNDGPDSMRTATVYSRAELRAVEWSAATAGEFYTPDPLYLPNISAGPYLAAVADLGSPAASDAEVASASPAIRAEVDRVSLGAGAFALTPSPDDTCPSGNVIDSAPNSGIHMAAIDVAAGDAATLLSGDAPVEIRLRRYADDLPALATAGAPAASATVIALPDDDAPLRTWQVALQSTAPFRICAGTE